MYGSGVRPEELALAIEITRNTPFGDFYLDVDGLGGDVDGDGLDDFVLGAASNDDDGSHAHAYLVRGFADGGSISQASLASGTTGWWIRDDLELDGVGAGVEVAVRGLGDVNGDDTPDFALVRSPARNGTP